MHLVYLFLAIGFELAGTISMKISNSFEKLVPTVCMVIFYVIAFFCLGLSLKKIEVGTAYAIWAGLGTALIAIVGVVYFQETMTPVKIAGLVLVIAGVVLLNLQGGH